MADDLDVNTIVQLCSNVDKLEELLEGKDGGADLANVILSKKTEGQFWNDFARAWRAVRFARANIGKSKAAIGQAGQVKR